MEEATNDLATAALVAFAPRRQAFILAARVLALGAYAGSGGRI